MATWGERRKHLIEAVLIAIGIAVIAGVAFAVLYKAPSCTDGKQDGSEQGVDCGGPCPYLCTTDQQPLHIEFAAPVSPQQNRTDIIAYINNPNAVGGVVHARYTAELYDKSGLLITTQKGTISVPPGTTAPLYIPNAYDGSHTVAQAFLTLDNASVSWLRSYQKPVLPVPHIVQMPTGSEATPKLTGVLTNPTPYAMYEVTVVATLFDANHNVLAASQTVVPTLPGQGSAPLVFTWNQPFRAPVASVEILPATGL